MKTCSTDQWTVQKEISFSSDQNLKSKDVDRDIPSFGSDQLLSQPNKRIGQRVQLFQLKCRLSVEKHIKYGANQNI